MKISLSFSRLYVSALVAVMLSPLSGQPDIEFLGLAGKSITDMATYGATIVVGTERDGIYYTDTFQLPDTSWINLGLEGEYVSAVYPHKSGPFGWGITAGLFPALDDPNYIYCNFMTEEFFSNSVGISDSLAVGVYSLAGFPDPTICGEKYAATGGALYRQAFGDTLWEPVYTSASAEGWGIRAVRTKENVGGLVMVGGSEGYTGVLLMKSLDYGDTWDHLYPPSPVLAFAFDMDSTGLDVGHIFVTDGEIIRRSLDGGLTWEAVFTEEYVHTFQSILYDAHTGYVFVAGSLGSVDTGHMLFSQDLGDSWQAVPVDALSTIVALALPGDGYLYFAATYSGVYRFAFSDLAIQKTMTIPSKFALYPSYPNPFNSSTIIPFDLPWETTVSLKVYDVLGREVTRLVEDRMRAGSYSTIWNSGTVPSGIYIARLIIPEHSKSIKMVLLK